MKLGSGVGSLESRVLSDAIRLGKVGAITSRLTDNHFNGANRKVFQYLRDHWSRHKAAPSLRFVQERFPTFNVTLAQVESTEDFNFIVEELIERSAMAALTGAIREGARRLVKCGQGQDELLDVINYFDKEVRGIRALSFSSDQFRMKEQAGTFLKRDYAAIQERDGMLGLKLGIDALDKCLHGAKAGEIIAIIGFTGEGKTYLSLLLAGLMWMIGYNIVFFSLEMDADTIARRLYVVLAGFSIEKYLSGLLTEDEISHIDEIAEELSAMTGELIIDDEPILSNQILRSKLIDYGCDAAFVDYLELMEGLSSERDNNRRHDEMVKGTKRTARELKIPIILNVQATKEAGDTKQPPKLSQVAGGMPLAKTADIILAFCRTASNYTIKVRKNRNAVLLPTIKLTWSPTGGKGLTCESTTVAEAHTADI